MPRRWRRRWWLGGAAGVLVLLGAAYLRATDPARLRQRTLAALRNLPAARIDVGQVRFSLAEGLCLRDLVIRQPPPADGPGRESPPLLHVSEARVRCHPLALLLGRIRPTGIRIARASATFITDPPGGPGRWELFAADAGAERRRRLVALLDHDLPPLAVAQADVQWLVREQGRTRLFQRQPVQLSAQPTAAGYRVRLDRLPVRTEPLLELEWTRATRQLALRLDWAALDNVERLLPQRPHAFAARADLEGRIRIQRLVLDLGRLAEPADGPLAGLTAAELHLDTVRCALPLEDDAWQPPAGRPARAARDCFLQLSQAAAILTYQRDEGRTPGRLRLRADGRLNAAPLELSLTARAATLPRLWALLAGTDPAADPGPPSLEDVLHAELRVAGFELPDTTRGTDLLRSSRVPAALAAAFDHYDPRGRVDVALRVRPADGPARGPAAERIEASIESAGGGRCRYYQFPYDFEDVRGRVRWSGGRVLLEGLAGRHGAGWARADGVVHSTRSWAGFELRFRGAQIALEQDLYAALPEPYQRLWQSAAPLGICDVAAVVRRPDGTELTGPQPAAVEVDARLLAGSLALADGRRLDHANGHFTIRDGVIRIHDLHAHDGPATVRLHGQASTSGGATRSDLNVELAGLPIRYEAPLAGDEGAPPQCVSFTGVADAWGRIQALQPGAGRRQHFALHITDGQLRGFDPQPSWTEAEGWLVVHDDRHELLSFTGRQGPARLEAAGTLPPAGGALAALDLELHAAAPALEQLVPQFVPRGWRGLAEALGLSGGGTVTVRLQPAPDAADGGPQARIRLRADRMRAEPLPLELHDVQADLMLAPGRFTLASAEARCGDGHVRGAAHGTWAADAADATIALSAAGLTFSPELLGALPPAWQRLIRQLAPAGQFDIYLPLVRLTGAAERTWRIEGRLPLRLSRLKLGLDLADIDGTLTGSCRIGPDGQPALDAALEVRTARIAGRPLANWRGQLLRPAGDDWVRLVDLQGRLCDGDAAGSVAIDPETSEYALSVTLQDVSAALLFPPPEDQPERRRRGRIDGHVSLRGRGADPRSRLGRGDLRLRGASFIQTPVLRSLAQAGSADRPAISDTVDQASIRFLWEGTRLRLLRVEIESRDLRLVGEGTWELADDTVRMVLVGAHPRHWPRVAVLTDLLESAGQELVQYEVEGPLSGPTVTTRPLYKVDAALRALLGQD